MHSAKTILLSGYKYFDSFEQRDGGRGVLSRTSEATGERTLYCASYGRNVYRFDIKTKYDTLTRLFRDSGVNVLLVGWTSRRLLSATSHQGKK